MSNIMHPILFHYIQQQCMALIINLTTHFPAWNMVVLITLSILPKRALFKDSNSNLALLKEENIYLEKACVTKS
jgi:hypothetical protein